jgi:hypothetical protein
LKRSAIPGKTMSPALSPESNPQTGSTARVLGVGFARTREGQKLLSGCDGPDSNPRFLRSFARRDADHPLWLGTTPKIRVSDAALAAELKAEGAQVLADYGKATHARHETTLDAQPADESRRPATRSTFLGTCEGPPGNGDSLPGPRGSGHFNPLGVGHFAD